MMCGLTWRKAGFWSSASRTETVRKVLLERGGEPWSLAWGGGGRVACMVVVMAPFMMTMVTTMLVRISTVRPVLISSLHLDLHGDLRGCLEVDTLGEEQAALHGGGDRHVGRVGSLGSNTSNI